MASPASKKRNTAPMDGNAAYDLHSTAAEEYRYSAPVEMPHAPRTTEAVVPESVPTPKQAIAPPRGAARWPCSALPLPPC